MNKTPLETVEFLRNFPKLVENTNHDVILCVPYLDLTVALELTKNTNKC